MSKTEQNTTDELLKGAEAFADTEVKFELKPGKTVVIKKITNKQLLGVIKLVGPRISQLFQIISFISTAEQDQIGMAVILSLGDVLEEDDLNKLVEILAGINDGEDYEVATTAKFLEVWLTVNPFLSLKQAFAPILTMISPKEEKKTKK